jgi:nicotinate-nucleotide pyrophosphorylase (carboxylating)
VRRTFPDVDIQVEVTTVAEALEAYAAGARFIMCDNMSVALLGETVAALRAQDEPVEIEATGGLTLEVARDYALTGRRLPVRRRPDPLSRQSSTWPWTCSPVD